MAVASEGMAARPCPQILTASESTASLSESTRLRIWTQNRAGWRHVPTRNDRLHLVAAASHSGSSRSRSSSSTSASTVSSGQEQDLSGYTPRRGRTSKQDDGGEKRKEGRGPKRRGAPKKEHKGRAAEAEEASYLSPAKYAAMAAAAADEKLLFERVPARQDAIYCVYAYPNEYSVGICRYWLLLRPLRCLSFPITWSTTGPQLSIRCAPVQESK